MTDSFEILKALAEDDRYNWMIVDFFLFEKNLKEFMEFLSYYPRRADVITKFTEPRELSFTVEGVTFDSFYYQCEPAGAAFCVNFYGFLIVEGRPSRTNHIILFTLRPGLASHYKVSGTCHEVTFKYFIGLLYEVYKKWPETHMELANFFKRIYLIQAYPDEVDRPKPPEERPKATRMKKRPKFDAINRVAMALFGARMKEVPTESAGARKYGTSIQTVNKLRDHPLVQDRLEYLLAHPELALRLRQQIAQERSGLKRKRILPEP